MIQPDVRAFSEALGRLMRLGQRARHRGDAIPGVDLNGYIVIKTIMASGASRASEVGHQTAMDPSIVTRQVQQLINAGMLERYADPMDGRASLLRCTPAGIEFFEDQKLAKENFYQTVFAEWSEKDVATLATLLTRLSIDMESALQRENHETPHQEK